MPSDEELMRNVWDTHYSETYDKEFQPKPVEQLINEVRIVPSCFIFIPFYS